MRKITLFFVKNYKENNREYIMNTLGLLCEYTKTEDALLN